jgi:hypothetical protein
MPRAFPAIRRALGGPGRSWRDVGHADESPVTKAFGQNRKRVSPPGSVFTTAVAERGSMR